MEETPVTTGVETPVGQESGSTGVTPPVSGSPPDDKRIRDLMSANDKLRSEKTAQIAAAAEAQRKHAEAQARITVLEAEKLSQLDAANKATEDALAAARSHESRSVTLEEELTRTKILAANPDLQIYAATILATPKEALEAVVANLKEATSRTRAQTTTAIREGHVPVTNPQRAGDLVFDARQIREYLDPSLPEKDFEARLTEMKNATHKVGRPTG